MSDSTLVELTFEATWSTFMIIYMLSAVLNGVIAMQACTYFHKFHRDSYILKSMVSFIWFGCVVFFLCESWVAHDIMILGYELPADMVLISLGFPIGLVVGMVVICSVQGVYIFRLYRFNHSKCLLVCCCLLAGVELGMGLAWAARVARTVVAWEDEILNQESKWISKICFMISTCLDVLITTSMCYQLWRSRSMGLKQTRYVVDKLMRWTIQTGLLTSAVALSIVLTQFFAIAGVWAGIGNLVPYCYATGLLALLNARINFRERFGSVRYCDSSEDAGQAAGVELLQDQEL